MKLMDRMLKSVGLRRISATAGGYRGGGMSRLTADWALSPMSSDQKLRSNLRLLRTRSRDLAENNPYMKRFLHKAKENVIGPNGILLQMGTADVKLNDQIESVWQRWAEKSSACGKMSLVDQAALWMSSHLQDGEVFARRIRGYEFNPYRYALQFIDPDMIDVGYNVAPTTRQDGTMSNEIRLGVEMDPGYRRPLAYWSFSGHPSEVSGVTRVRLSADDVEHAYVFHVLNQTRGVPAPYAVLLTLNMLGGLEEAELVGSRLAACKMGAILTKDGENYTGEDKDESGASLMDAEPGTFHHLATGEDFKPIDWNHPNQNFPEFQRSMLRGIAAGCNTAYATMTGDLREVNFSSIRAGILDEREGWKVLQTFAVTHFYKPAFEDFLRMAILTGQLQIPSRVRVEDLVAAATWVPRGWDWVDPLKDSTSDIMAIRAGLSTMTAVCAKRGLNFKDVIDRRALEIDYCKKMGVPADFTTNGAGGVQGDGAAESQPGAAPANNRSNGKGALALYEDDGERNHLVRLEQ